MGRVKKPAALLVKTVPISKVYAAVDDDVRFCIVLAHEAVVKVAYTQRFTYIVHLWYTWNDERRMIRASNGDSNSAIRAAFKDAHRFLTSKKQHKTWHGN